MSATVPIERLTGSSTAFTARLSFAECRVYSAIYLHHMNVIDAAIELNETTDDVLARKQSIERKAEAYSAERAKRALDKRQHPANRPEPIEAKVDPAHVAKAVESYAYAAGALQSLMAFIIDQYEAGDERSLRDTLGRAKGIVDGLDAAWRAAAS